MIDPSSGLNQSDITLVSLFDVVNLKKVGESVPGLAIGQPAPNFDPAQYAKRMHSTY
jgi:hypothetical protein